jgi:hypothetical protein
MLRHEASPTDKTAALCLNMTEAKKIEVKAGVSQPINAGFAFQIKIHLFNFDVQKLTKQDFNIKWQRHQK